MASRTFEQVLADVQKQSDPQRTTILNTISSLPTQQAADEAALSAQKDQAYSDILAGARRRGVGVAFGGIPLAEQAQYNATDYAPAVAKLKTSYNDRKSTLENALAQIGQNDYNSAYSIFDNDRKFEYQQEQDRLARAQAAAQQANIDKYLNQLNSNSQNSSNQQQTAKPAGAYGFKNGKDGSSGFYFRDAYGNPISAARYASLSGISLPNLVMKMASAGDTYAQSAVRSMNGAGGIDQNKFYLLFNTTSKPASSGGGGW